MLGENSHDAIPNISRRPPLKVNGTVPCLILKQQPRGAVRLSDQNQPPLWTTVPNYCVLSKYLILTLCWELIKYPASGKTSTEKIPFQTASHPPPHQRCGMLPTLVCYDPKITSHFFSFSWRGSSAVLDWDNARGWAEPKAKRPRKPQLKCFHYLYCQAIMILYRYKYNNQCHNHYHQYHHHHTNTTIILIIIIIKRLHTRFSFDRWENATK